VSSVASSPAIQRNASASANSLARMMREMPKRRITATCVGVAAVMPHAPRASCISNSCGDMVVFPCGASLTPLLSQ
jgi:hypothetical protein